MPTPSRSAAYVALAGVCVLWGTTYLGIRMALEGFPPAILMSARYFLSGAILLLIAWARGAYLPRGRELRTTIISGALSIGAGNGALSYAEQWMPSGLASLIISMSPFWFVLFEALLPNGAPLHGPTILGMLVGLAGTTILFLPGASTGALNSGFVAGFFVLQLGMMGWTLGAIYQRRQATRAHPIVTGAVQQLASAAAFFPFAVLAPHGPILWKPRAVWAIVYLVVFGSILGYSAYAYTMARLPVAVASIYSYVNPVVAVALGWLFYREPFGLREVLAMMVIFAGVAIVKWQSARGEKQAQQAKLVERTSEAA